MGVGGVKIWQNSVHVVVGMPTNEIKTEPTLLVELFTFTTMSTGSMVFETYKIVVLNYIYSNPPNKWAELYFSEGLMKLQG